MKKKEEFYGKRTSKKERERIKRVNEFLLNEFVQEKQKTRGQRNED